MTDPTKTEIVYAQLRARIFGIKGLDHGVHFPDIAGRAVVTYVPWFKVQDLITRTDEVNLLRVELLRKFNRISHIRLPSGNHVHVRNEQLEF